MKKSTSILLSSLVALGMLSTAANAAGKIKKGQKGYLKTCKKCHGNGTKGAAMKSQDEWNDLFADGGAKIKALHKGDKSEKFFNGKKFKKLAPHLNAFLYEYANDSGNVPSCG
jgi:hypothetical protein